MSERSRGPEGSSGPANTQSDPSGGDDIYAAAAASAAGRTAKRGAPGRPARSAGSAPEAQTDGSSTATRAQPSENEHGPSDPTRDAGSRSNGAHSRQAQSPNVSSGGANAGGASANGAAEPAAETADKPAAQSAASGSAGSEAGSEPTSKLSAVANSVLNRVRSTGKADGDRADGDRAAAASPDDRSGAGASDSGSAGSDSAGGAAAGAAVGAAATSGPKNSPTTARGATSPTADSANEPTTAMKRESFGPLPNSNATAGDQTAEQGKADKPKVGTPRGTRKARLRLSRLDPWSVMKTAFLFSIAAGIVMVVAVYAVWLVIGSSGLFDSVDSIVGSVLQSPGDTTPFRIEDYVNTQKVMGVTAFLACIDVVIFTALATLASFLYNLAATMLGGLEVTLAED